MKKRVLIGILTGALALSALFAGCSQANTNSDSEAATASTTAATAKATEKTTKAAGEKATDAEKTTESVTEQATVQESTEFTVEETTTAATEAPTNAPEEAPAEEATRTDGSVLTKTEYRDAIWGMTMKLPETWQDNIYVLNNSSSEGRSLSFVEKTNYDSGKEFGLIFKLQESDEPVEESNNTKAFGSFTNSAGNTVYISVFTPSDVRANILDEALAANYRNVFTQKDEALASITFEN